MSSDPFVTTTAARGLGAGGAATRSGLFGGTTTIEDPPSLKRAGTGALELAGELHSKAEVGENALFIGAQGFFGDWGGELGTSMLDAKESWVHQTAALVRTCRDLHEQCSTTADNYTKTETANAETMSAASKTRSPFG